MQPGFQNTKIMEPLSLETSTQNIQLGTQVLKGK